MTEMVGCRQSRSATLAIIVASTQVPHGELVEPLLTTHYSLPTNHSLHSLKPQCCGQQQHTDQHDKQRTTNFDGVLHAG